MALNQSVHLAPGRASVVARVERIREPGQPRQYWDAEAKAWSPDPGHPLRVIPDPDLDGLYLIQESSEHTASWPDGIYRITGLDTASDSADRVAFDPILVQMIDGDDGGLSTPSTRLRIPGGTVTITRSP